MTEFVSQVITAAATLIAALSGVLITQRHQRNLAEIERADRRRAELRSHVVQFLVSAREWASAQQVAVLALWKASDVDFVPLANSESFARLAELRLAVTTELHHLLGLVGDERLQTAVYKAHDLWIEVPDSVMGPVIDGGRKADDRAPRESILAIRAIDAAVTDVRDAAVPLLRVAIIESEPPKRWRFPGWPASSRQLPAD